MVLEGSVEVEIGAGVPVAVDIHGHGHATAGGLVVLGAAGRGVLCSAVVGVEIVGTLVVGLRQAPFHIG